MDEPQKDSSPRTQNVTTLKGLNFRLCADPAKKNPDEQKSEQVKENEREQLLFLLRTYEEYCGGFDKMPIFTLLFKEMLDPLIGTAVSQKLARPFDKTETSEALKPFLSAEVEKNANAFIKIIDTEQFKYSDENIVATVKTLFSLEALSQIESQFKHFFASARQYCIDNDYLPVDSALEQEIIIVLKRAFVSQIGHYIQINAGDAALSYFLIALPLDVFKNGDAADLRDSLVKKIISNTKFCTNANNFKDYFSGGQYQNDENGFVREVVNTLSKKLPIDPLFLSLTEENQKWVVENFINSLKKNRDDKQLSGSSRKELNAALDKLMSKINQGKLYYKSKLDRVKKILPKLKEIFEGNGKSISVHSDYKVISDYLAELSPGSQRANYINNFFAQIKNTNDPKWVVELLYISDEEFQFSEVGKLYWNNDTPPEIKFALERLMVSAEQYLLEKLNLSSVELMLYKKSLRKMYMDDRPQYEVSWSTWGKSVAGLRQRGVSIAEATNERLAPIMKMIVKDKTFIQEILNNNQYKDFLSNLQKLKKNPTLNAEEKAKIKDFIQRIEDKDHLFIYIMGDKSQLLFAEVEKIYKKNYNQQSLFKNFYKPLVEYIKTEVKNKLKKIEATNLEDKQFDEAFKYLCDHKNFYEKIRQRGVSEVSSKKISSESSSAASVGASPHNIWNSSAASSQAFSVQSQNLQVSQLCYLIENSLDPQGNGAVLYENLYNTKNPLPLNLDSIQSSIRYYLDDSKNNPQHRLNNQGVDEAIARIEKFLSEDFNGRNIVLLKVFLKLLSPEFQQDIETVVRSRSDAQTSSGILVVFKQNLLKMCQQLIPGIDMNNIDFKSAIEELSQKHQIEYAEPDRSSFGYTSF